MYIVSVFIKRRQKVRNIMHIIVCLLRKYLLDIQNDKSDY